MTATGDPSVAIAHWHIDSWGGAEYLVTKLAEALSVGTIHTIGPPSPDEPNPYGDVTFHDVCTDLALGSVRHAQSKLGRLFEYAIWEDVDWREYGDPDVILTSGATTRAVITPDDTLHCNYCHSPPRWLYDRYHDRIASLSLPAATAARPVLRHLRTRDAAVDNRVDAYLANSPVIERRLWKFYGRDSTVLYPPVDVEAFDPQEPGEFYLHVGRLDSEKGVAAVVEAFADLDARLVLAGPTGDDTDRVRARVQQLPNVEYRGFVSTAEKRALYERARAVVFNGVAEDFGIVPIEAIAAGTACLVRDEGFPGMFADGETGGLHDGSVAGIREAVERFETAPFGADPERAEPFAADAFAERLRELVADRYEQFDKRFQP